MKQPRTLFVRTSLTIFIALFIFMVFASGVVFHYLMQPIARQAAGDLAALMVLSAQTWVELPPDSRPRFEQELADFHGLSISDRNDTLRPIENDHPFFHFLKQTLEELLEQPVDLFEDVNNDRWIWVDIPMSRDLIHIGFPNQHIGPNPPQVIFLLLAGAGALIFITSSILVRRLTQPLEMLTQATLQMGQGVQIPSLEETGAKEFVLLTRNFNQMNHRVEQLLANRNTLFAGISHDLRTPISRIHLALELLEGNSDPELIKSIRYDLQEMNHLITQTLELATSYEKAQAKLEVIDLNELIASEVEKFQHEYKDIQWRAKSDCKALISITAFQRIFQNLLDNAIRYGDNSQIQISLTCDQQQIKVCIADQGPGIPLEHQSNIFQPFHRLETSRSSSTGGSGLGLAIVSQLCELYGWTIQVNCDNNGSIFCLSLNQPDPQQLT
ncbi:MAG: ATP-binding protein [Gammaproteobacteria bacterium]|nr:ATP-binding protein [Gammaproteobacteria bacterium]